MKFRTNLLFLLLFVSTQCAAFTYIDADDKRFLYSGRVDFSASKSAYLTWPGSSVKANFTGDELVVVLSDDEGKNFFNVILNGDDQFPHVLQLKKGKHEYDLSSALVGLQESVKQIELFKRTEGHEGGSHFHGFKLADNHELSDKPDSKKRKIAFFGDSVTSGMGNEAPYNGVDNLESEKNHYMSYAAITARNLNAEFHTISSSGIGFMVSWFDHILPQVYDQLSGVGNNDTAWDFARWQADIVVVNIGQNDSWLIDNEKRLKPEPTTQDIIDAYADFILRLATHYPDAQFICALGSMDVSSKAHWIGYINEAMKQVKERQPDIKIDTVQFEFTGYARHPRVYQHVKNAHKLTYKIKNIMGW